MRRGHDAGSARAREVGKRCTPWPPRILWHLLRFKEPFYPEVFAQEAAKLKRKQLHRLQALATTLNFRLVPNQ